MVDDAADGIRGLELLNAVRPDAAIIDIGLPGLDGYQVARKIRAEPHGRGMLLLALTGYDAAGDAARASEHGFDYHLVKPVDPDHLARLLSESAERSLVRHIPETPISRAIRLAVPQMLCDGRDRCRQLDWINGLRDVRLESCGEDSSPIFRARVTRQRDRRKKTSVFSFILPNPPDQAVPVLIRQADIAHQDVGPLRFEHLKRFPDRRRRFHAGARLCQHH